MEMLIFLIPISLGLGAVGLLAFLWALRSGQFSDLEGDAARILLDDQPLEADPPKERRRPAEAEDAERPSA